MDKRDISELLERRKHALDRIDSELDHAYNKHSTAPWSRHEFYAILKEEVDELWEAIKADEPISEVENEAIQVAAMCLRFLETHKYNG